MRGNRFLRLRSAAKGVTFGLGRRLMLVFGTLLSFFVAAALLVNLQTQKELIEQRLSARVESLGQLVVDISSSHLYQMRVAELEVILEDIYRQPDVAYIYLLDENNLRLANGEIEDTSGFLVIQRDSLAELARDTGQNQQIRGARTEDVALPVILGSQYLGTIRLGIALEEFNSDLKTVQSRNLSLGVIFVIVGIMLTGLIARQLTRPLGDLINMTHRASKGDLNQSIGLRTNDELEFLATSFTDMMAALRKSMRDVQILAYRDKLTGLPNRAWFNEYFENMTAEVVNTGRAAALLFLDIDRFKNINDTMGHFAGDSLLEKFAGRLVRSVEDASGITVQKSEPGSEPQNFDPSQAAIARLGGDEFTIVLPMIDNKDTPALVAQEIIASLVESFDLGKTKQTVSTSIGIALLPDHGTTASMLLKNADTAMYQAKNAGRGKYRFFDAAIAKDSFDRLKLEDELRLAIAEDQFEILYQPQFAVDSCRVIGAEALLRWHNPNVGVLAPDFFLQVAEDAQLMPAIGRLVVAKSLKDAQSWPRPAGRPLRLAINASIKELETAEFSDLIIDEIQRTGFEPEALEIEITEGAVIVDDSLVETHVKRLRLVGVRFAVDDFGVGYSNLARLKQLDFETLKIDRGLTRDIGSDRNAEALVVSILEMSRALSLDVVAEGIENTKQMDFLRKVNCGFAQGYSLARPMTQSDFCKLASQNSMSFQNSKNRRKAG